MLWLGGKPEVAMTTTVAATITTTTLAVTTGIPVMDVTKETGVISPTDLPIMVLSNPGVLLRVTPIQFALLVDVDTKESVVELQSGEKRVMETPSFGFHHMPSPRPAVYSSKEVMYHYYHPHLTSGDGFDHEIKSK
nr:hypothetical protein [Tanacetum cinerariifolium]